MKELAQIKKMIAATITEEGDDGLSGIYETGGKRFRYVFSYGGGWEHCSVSIKGHKRCPTWEEMCMFKDIFWLEDETVIQIHPAKSQYVNTHKYCLHLWKPIDKEIPKPPKSFVG